MAVIKITSKRQATLPKTLCNDLGISAGAELCVEKQVINGEMVWTMRPKSPRTKWFGALRKYAHEKTHDMKDIRKSIGKGVGKNKH